MTHALADVVLVEQFQPVALRRLLPEGIGVDCPACPWTSAAAADLGEMLTAARRHILEDHPGGDPLAREHAYTAALHAVDATTGDTYPALIPELLMPAELPKRLVVNECQQCGRTVRGPLVPLYYPDRTVVWAGPGCLEAHRQNISHIPDPLPIPPADGAP